MIARCFAPPALAALAALATLALAGCREEEPPPPPQPPEVEVTTAAAEPITSYVRYTGTLEATETAEIRARVPGFLEEIRFEPSTDVEVGETLFIIEQRPYQVQVNAAKADIQNAEAQLELARTQLRRLELALEKGAVNEIEIIEQRAEVKRAEAQLDVAKSALEQAELDLSYTDVQSPIAGRVSEHLVDQGNLVGSGENTLLTTVLALDSLYAYFDVSEAITLRYLGRGEDGSERSAGFPPAFLGTASEEGYPHEGRIDFVDNALDQTTGTLRVRAVFDNDNARLYPGLFVRIRVPFEEIEQAILVEEEAVGTDLSGKYLLLVDDQSVVQKQRVTLGDRQDGGRVHILEGLSGGERYIVRGLQRARPGLPVRVASGSAPSGGGGG